MRGCPLNHIATSVYNGEQLLDLLLERGFYKRQIHRNPELIILDLDMQVIDGYAALKEIRDHDNLKDIPVYVITDQSGQSSTDTELKQAATGLLRRASLQADLETIITAACKAVRS